MIIYKYPLTQDFTAVQTVIMPAGAQVLHVGEQHGMLCVWAMVRQDATPVNYKFFVLGTGQSIDHLEFDVKFLGSVQMSTGLVWHVFYKSGL